jgi:hypothetical protein
LLIHIDESLFDESGKIEPQRLDAVARLGRTYYARINADNIFSIVQPQSRIGIGFDQLPAHVRHSNVLTGNELAELASVPALPGSAEILEMQNDSRVMSAREMGGNALHRLASEMIQNGAIQDAWKVLLI